MVASVFLTTLVVVVINLEHVTFDLLFKNLTARRDGAEVAGWTLDRKIRVRFPAYPHRVWAL